jgi:aryl sulfotransferase
MDSRRWDAYRPREGDIVIATYPKCGTTWTQRIVSALVFQSAEPRPLSVSPWIDERFLGSPEEITARIEAQTHRRFLKSHLPLDALPIYDGVSYIHVARDGLDAFMSWHNHQREYKRMELLDKVGLTDETIARPYPRPAEAPHDFFQAWIGANSPANEGDVSATAFFETERTYWVARSEPNVLLVHYADMLVDLDGEMRRIADFLKIKTPAALWPDLVRAATFEQMRSDGVALMPFAKAAWTGGHETFIYSGKNERWRNALTEADIARYRSRAANEMSPALNAWLATGRRGAGEP